MVKRELTDADRHAIISACWARGELSYKLYPHQLPIYRAFWRAIENPNCLKFAANVARRFGKSTIACLVAFEYALRNPNSYIKFATSTNKQMRAIMRPLFTWLLSDCPAHLRPTILGGRDGDIFSFPNGSEITFSGVDNQNADNLRGTSSHLNFIDEAGTVDELDYVVNDVMMPMQLTVDGTMIVYGTPAPALDHYWTKLFKDCAAEGNSITRTIEDNASVTPEKLALYAREAGGEDSTTFKREYLAQWINDQDLMIVPEWVDNEQDCVGTPGDDPLRTFYHKYVSLDLGIRDFTTVLYGYYDFKNARLVIEREFTVNGPDLTTQLLADRVKLDEEQLWSACKQRTYRRIADNNNPQLLNDMQHLHKLSFGSVRKGLLEAMVNEIRLWVKDHRLLINPDCVYLIGNLKHGYWERDRKSFAHSLTYKHFDHLAALMYLIRSIDEITNPVPATLGMSPETHHISPEVLKSNKPELDAFARKLLNRNDQTPYQRFLNRRG